MENCATYRVMVVDDETSIVNAVRRELSQPPFGRFRYQVEGFTDPQAALRRLEEHSFAAVISDYRMPGMDGLTFLKAVRHAQPECALLVLSGQTDLHGLVQLINETHIYRFIPKPWHDYFLKSSLAQAIQYAEELRENRRLAQRVHEHGIALPESGDAEPEQLLVVATEVTERAALTQALTHHALSDEVYAAIYAELAHEPPPLLAARPITVLATPSAHRALAMAEDSRFACIIAGRQLSEMNGIDLLQRMEQQQPDCVRLLLGGEVGEDELISAVDLAHIFGVIRRPWQDFELKATVAQALAWRRMQLSNRLLASMVRAASGG